MPAPLWLERGGQDLVLEPDPKEVGQGEGLAVDGEGGRERMRGAIQSPGN